MPSGVDAFFILDDATRLDSWMLRAELIERCSGLVVSGCCFWKKFETVKICQVLRRKSTSNEKLEVWRKRGWHLDKSDARRAMLF